MDPHHSRIQMPKKSVTKTPLSDTFKNPPRNLKRSLALRTGGPSGLKAMAEVDSWEWMKAEKGAGQ
jgi:hypothetical protein